MKRIHEVQLPTGLLTVKEDRSGTIDLLSICRFGARNNANRGFLFVSSELGKHVASVPSEMISSHRYLAQKIESDEHPTLFVGMAETAVGLGYGVFDAWIKNHPDKEAVFLHTTRYRLYGTEALDFEESHSHAPNQIIHKPKDEHIARLMAKARTLVLIDDEASTGKTFVNLWNVLRMQHPMLNKVNILTLTNFMNEQARESLSEAIGVPVRFAQVVSGAWTFEPDAPFMEVARARQPIVRDQGKKQVDVLPSLGRSGIASRIDIPDSVWAVILSVLPDINTGSSRHIRIIGTGEFMHAPFVLGLALENMGHAVTLQSTTRSPVLEFGPIKSTLQLTDPYGMGDPYFLYNAQRSRENETTFILHEMNYNEAIADMVTQLDGVSVHWNIQ